MKKTILNLRKSMTEKESSCIIKKHLDEVKNKYVIVRVGGDSFFDDSFVVIIES